MGDLAAGWAWRLETVATAHAQFVNLNLTDHYSDIPESDGRRLWIGWMVDLRYAEEVPTTPWLGGMTLPRELVLKRTSSGLRIAQRPCAK